MGLKCTITEDSIAVVIDGESIIRHNSEDDYAVLEKAVLSKDWDTVRKLASPKHAVQAWADGLFQVVDGKVLRDGKAIPERLSDRIIKMANAGEDPIRFLRFFERLQANPEKHAVEQLYNFLDKKDIPIDENGFILAYKSVRANLASHHDSYFRYEIGREATMERSVVAGNPMVACGKGLHAGAMDYVGGFGGLDSKILVVAIDPADVVSVPNDSSHSKIRCCRMKPLGFKGEDLLETSYDLAVLRTEDTMASNEPMIPDEWAQMTLRELRKYAYKVLGMPGAAHIRGGKAALLKAMKKFDDEKTGADLPTPEAREQASKRAPTHIDFDKWGSFTRLDLNKLPLRDLRRYATHGIGIIGASKIRGGKDALIDKIIETRDGK